MSHHEAFTILMIDDNPDDAEMTRIALEGIDPPIEFRHEADGAAGLAHLRANAGGIDLVLLDINMPVLDGFGAMAAIVSDPALSYLPVVAFTTSKSPDDVRRMAALRCNAYVVKPLGIRELRKALAAIVGMWRDLARRPNAQ